MTDSRPQISVAIPTYLRDEYLLDTIEQVLNLNDFGRAELLVLDQTPDHDVAIDRALRAYERDGLIVWKRMPSPSLTKARNLALSSAMAPIVLFIDDDVLLPPEFLSRHIEAHLASDAAVVGGQVFHCLDYRKPPPLSHPQAGTRPDSEMKQPGFVFGIIGCNHSIKKEIALGMGGYDEAFVGSALAEDMDFSRRILDLGYRIFYEPAAWLIHLRTPHGGCAVNGATIWPEWNHSSGLLLYALRHGLKNHNFLHFVWMALRNGPLRREILLNPLRWFEGCLGFIRGFRYAYSRRVFHSSKSFMPRAPSSPVK